MRIHSLGHPRCCVVAILCILAALTLPSGADDLLPVRVFRAENFHARPVSGWDYDSDGDGKADFRTRDGNGDGVIDTYLYDNDRNGTFEASASTAGPDGSFPRHLIVFADAVPYDVMKELWDEGHFRDFFPPGRVISSFPSHTNPAFTEIFGSGKTEGIEDRYYDRERNRVVGGFTDHMKRRDRKTDDTFHAVFGYEENPRYGGLIYLAPYAVSDHDIEMLRKAFWKQYRNSPPDKPIILYLGSTDAIAHREGRAGLRRQLLRLEKVLRGILHKTAGALRVSIVSDHGNNLVRSERMVGLGRFLAAHGYRLTDSLKDAKDVAAPCLGLLNVISLYTAEENKALLAEILKGLEGVDFVACRDDGKIFVTDSEGSARIDTRGKKYKYEVFSGDPLGLVPVMEEMMKRREIDEDGFADDRAWFEATKDHRYPDILARLAASMTDHVKNVPDLFLSLEDGYSYGTPFFLEMIDLKGTHGSALDSSTYGIAMSTSKRLPPYIRTSGVMEALGEEKPGD